MLTSLTVWITTNCGKFFKRREYQKTFIYLLRNLYSIQEQQSEPDLQQTGSKPGKEQIRAVYDHPVYLTYIQYIMRNARLDEDQAGVKIARRNINNLR